MRRRLAACALAWTAALATPGAAPAAGPSCHCFRDREYDPARPKASDAYLLATAANSLLSAVSGIPKREIVQARMSGAAGEDLWVAAHAARRLGADQAALRKARAAAASWRDVLGADGGGFAALGPRFVAALAAGDTALARVAAAEALAARLGTPWAELDELGSRGATLQETVLAALIGSWTEKPAPEVFAAAAGAGGWSGLLAAAGKVPKQMEAEIQKVLGGERPGK